MIRQEAIDFDKAVAAELEGLVLNPRGVVEWRKDGVLLTAFFFYEDRRCREDVLLSKKMWQQLGPEQAAGLLSRVLDNTMENATVRAAEVAPRL